MTPEKYIHLLTGISKRLFVALSDLRGKPPQIEDALFQLASVIDSTSKQYYPKENLSKKRFVNYLTANETDIFFIASGGQWDLKDCHFIDKQGKSEKFGEILYRIRCSSYHDPEELETLIHFGDNNRFGHTEEGKFIVNESLIQAIFAVLLTDKVNKNLIDKALFTKDQYLIFKSIKYPWYDFRGDREKLLKLFREQ